MSIQLISTLLQKRPPVDWGETAILNGKEVQLIDVDLKGKFSFTDPMTATITILDGGRGYKFVGVYWPGDAKPETVTINDAIATGGKVSLAFKIKPFKGRFDIPLRMTWGDNKEGSLAVTGKVKVKDLI